MRQDSLTLTVRWVVEVLDPSLSDIVCVNCVIEGHWSVHRFAGNMPYGFLLALLEFFLDL